MLIFYKILRTFFKIFGKNNAMYQKFNAKVRKFDVVGRLKHIEYVNAYFLAYMRFKQHYGLEIPADAAGFGNKFEYVHIKLKDIVRKWDGHVYSLKDCSPYKYLETGNKKIYETYIKKHVAVGYCPDDTVWDVKEFDDLCKSIKKEGYNPQKSVICVDKDNAVIDGQHRACCLLYLYGEDYEINVIRISKI